jgi:hypothetical protein
MYIPGNAVALFHAKQFDSALSYADQFSFDFGAKTKKLPITRLAFGSFSRGETFLAGGRCKMQGGSHSKLLMQW